MASYKYEVVGADGKPKTGTIEAMNMEVASAELKSGGNTIVSIARANAFNKDLEIHIGKAVSVREMSVFCRQFESVLNAGVTVVEALDMLSEQTENKQFANAIAEVRDSVQRGETLAVAMAEHLCGSEQAFVARMNERATELGCEHTHFANATGLHNSQHYTTAWDLYLITREALKHDKFMEICNSKSYTVPATNMTDKPRELHSTNFLISNWRARGYVYRDAQGIKTGSTPEAGYCLISSALRGSRHMISVVLGAERVTLEDGVTIQTRSFSETSRMFDWGFDNFVLRDILSSSDLVQEVPVALSSEASYVSTHAAEDIACLLPDNVEPDMLERTVTLTNDTVDAPVSAGDVLGKLTLSCNGKVYAETDLLALNDVSASWFLTAQRRVSDFFAKPLVRILLIVVVLLIVALVVYVTMFSRRRRYGHRRRGRAGSGYRGRRRRF